jgi:hypothetical protein
MMTFKKIFLLYLIFMVSGCALFPVEPDQSEIAKIDPTMAKTILQRSCPTCNDSTVRLNCADGYFVDRDKRQTTVEYPYHNLAMICYIGYVEIMGRQTDCVSSWNREKLPRIEIKAEGSEQLCNAAFAAINHAREQKGIGAWDYYKQKAEPEK